MFLFLLTMYIYCVYPAMSKNKLSDKNRNKLGRIIFMDVFHYVHAYTVIGALPYPLHESDTKKLYF